MPLPKIAKNIVHSCSFNFSIGAHLRMQEISAPPSFPLQSATPPSGGADISCKANCQEYLL